jgi:hypothetical protein
MAEPVSRAAEIIAVTFAVRHCTEYGCQKCIARARWGRRKKWRSRKSPNRSATGRK